MVKSKQQTVRETEARKRNKGLHEYRVWAPGAEAGGHDPEVKSALNECADKLIRKRKRATGAKRTVPAEPCK